jgi:hypothetical protein
MFQSIPLSGNKVEQDEWFCNFCHDLAGALSFIGGIEGRS